MRKASLRIALFFGLVTLLVAAVAQGAGGPVMQ